MEEKERLKCANVQTSKFADVILAGDFLEIEINGSQKPGFSQKLVLQD